MAKERKGLPGEVRDFAADIGKDLRTTAVKETSKGIVRGILWVVGLTAAVLAYVLVGLSERGTGVLLGVALFGLLHLLLHWLRRLYLRWWSREDSPEIIVIENESAAINRMREARQTCLGPVFLAYGYVYRACRSEEMTVSNAGPKYVISDLIQGEILPRCKDVIERFENKLKEPGVTVADREEVFELFRNVMYSTYPKLTRLIRVQLSYILGFERVFGSSEYAELQRLDGLMQEEMHKLWENLETRPVAGEWELGSLRGLLTMPPLARPSEGPPPSTASEPDQRP